MALPVKCYYNIYLFFYYIAIIFHRRVWHRARSLRYACIQSSGIILIPYSTFVPNFVSFLAFIAQLAHGKNCVLNHSLNHSITQLIQCPGNQSACALEQ